MNKRYQISISEVRNFVNHYATIVTESTRVDYAANNAAIKEHLEKLFRSYEVNKIVDGERIEDIFFPTETKQRFKVFISHSGKDKDEVEKLALILQENDINCFVDWMVWGNLADLQKIIDDKYCVLKQIKDENNKTRTTYNYDARNYSTAHTHAMLSMALLEMIDQCDICLFVTSENSTLPGTDFGDVMTLSPWIYEEIKYMNRISPKAMREFSEDANRINISHPLDLSDFGVVNSRNLINSINGLYD